MHSGRVVIMDLGFCVLQALIELSLVGVYSSAVIKKRRYWPKCIVGEGINQHFQTTEVGQCDSLPGTLSVKAFSIFCIKEENYTMKLMDTYGALVEIDECKILRLLTAVNSEKFIKSFNNTEPFHNHLKFHHRVDDHNNSRHSPLSLEESWATKDWEHRVFSFIIYLVEVNARLSHGYFNDELPLTHILFWKQLARELIEYSEKDERTVRRRKQDVQEVEEVLCYEETAPLHARTWTGTEWTYLHTEYPQRICRPPNCKKQIRTYCSFNIGY
jgi:Transposase IS4